MENQATTVVSAITSAASTVASDCLSAITTSLPVILPVMGAFIVVGVGIKLIKRFTH